MSIFGGPEACKRVMAFEQAVIDIEARVKKYQCLDADVSHAISSARGFLEKAWQQHQLIKRQVAFDAWSNCNIAWANYFCTRGGLYVLRASKTMDALFPSI